MTSVPRAAALRLAVLALAGGCCCRGGAPAAPAPTGSATAGLVVPPPAAVRAQAAAPVHAHFRNVHFRFAPQIALEIEDLEGVLTPKIDGAAVVLDDDTSFVLQIQRGRTALTAGNLTRLLNEWVFAYPGAPLRNLSVTFRDGRLRQSGILHKGVDIPFQMEASVAVTPAGEIRLHPTSMKICSIPGKGLMDALGIHLSDLLDLRRAHGVRVAGDDLYFDPTAILPPPAIDGHLVAVAVLDSALVQTWRTGTGADSTAALGAAAPPLPDAPNFMYFRGGVLRFGKLFMVATDMQVVDADAADPFDFFLDRYVVQLAAGRTENLPDFGLLVHMPDYDDTPALAASRKTGK